MNRKSVIIKSNKYGLTVILDDKMPFQELLLDIADKFQESANFFRNAKISDIVCCVGSFEKKPVR